MSKALTLRDRMKQYETVTKNWLTLRTPKIVRLDMKGGAGFCGPGSSGKPVEGGKRACRPWRAGPVRHRKEDRLGDRG